MVPPQHAFTVDHPQLKRGFGIVHELPVLHGGLARAWQTGKRST